MAVQTPITNSTFDVVAGNVRMQIAKFTSVADGDTYLTDLGTIIAVNAEGGNTATVGETWSGSTVTFHIASGPATNVTFVAWGF
jgi:hypothetical protein